MAEHPKGLPAAVRRGRPSATKEPGVRFGQPGARKTFGHSALKVDDKLKCAIDELLAEGFVTDIAGQCNCGPTFCANERDHLARIFFLYRQVADGHVGTLADERDRRRAADPESPPVISAFRPASLPEPA
jgi:hypothetical protein